MFGPLLPFLSDDQRSVDGLLNRRRPCVWTGFGGCDESASEGVAIGEGAFGRPLPATRERYEAVLHWPKVREAYVKGDT